MANIPSNSTGIVTTTTITGSFSGFTVVSGSATITGLKDYNDNNLTELSNWSIPAGTTIPLFVTSASLSSGTILFYK